MGDGSSGLSLSEIGISAVKKTAQVVKKAVTPIGQQVKAQVGGTFIPGQSPQGISMPSDMSAPGSLDISSMLGETDPFGNSKPTTTTTPSAQDPQLAAQFQKQSAEDKQKIESLRNKLHQMYYEDFIKKAEGQDNKSQEEQKKKQEEAEQEEQKRQEEQAALSDTLQMTQGPQKGNARQTKSNLMNLIKPKQGSHEGKSAKG